MKKILVGSLLACVGVWSCSQTSDTPPQNNEPVITQVNNTTPTGSVAGRVYDFTDGLKVDGVQVRVTSGAQSFDTTSNSDGEWKVEGVPAGGTVGVFMTKSPYFDARVTVPLDDAAGNFPTGNAYAFVGPVSLLSKSGLEVTVLFGNGQPAAAAVVYLDVPAAFVVEDNAGAPQLRGTTHETNQTGPNGVVNFVNLPSPAALATRFPTLTARLTVAAPPQVAGQPAWAGTTQDVTLQTLLQQQLKVTIVLPQQGATTALKIIASNVPDFISDRVVQTPGVIAPSTADTESVVRLVFNQPVNPASVEARMVAEDGAPLDPNGMLTRLTVRAPGAAMGMETAPASILEVVMPRASPGVEGNLFMRVSSAAGTSTLNVAVPVYFEQPAALAIRELRQTVSSTADGALTAGETVEAVLNQAVGGRTATGTAGMSTDFAPVLVTVTQGVSSFSTTGRLQEPSPRPPHVLGGYTTRVSFAIPSDLMTTLTPSALSVTLEFNDSARRDGGPSAGAGALTVTTPTGVPVTTVSSNGLTAALLPADVMGPP